MRRVQEIDCILDSGQPLKTSNALGKGRATWSDCSRKTVEGMRELARNVERPSEPQANGLTYLLASSISVETCSSGLRTTRMVINSSVTNASNMFNANNHAKTINDHSNVYARRRIKYNDTALLKLCFSAHERALPSSFTSTPCFCMRILEIRNVNTNGTTKPGVVMASDKPNSLNVSRLRNNCR